MKPGISLTDFRNNLFGQKITKELVFSNDTGTLTLFTVTGDVIVRVIPVTPTSVASVAAANIQLGWVGKTDGMIVDTLATDLDAREFWLDASPTDEGESLDDMKSYMISDGNNIVLTLDDQVDSGAITFYCFWIPLSDDGNVEVA